MHFVDELGHFGVEESAAETGADAGCRGARWELVFGMRRGRTKGASFISGDFIDRHRFWFLICFVDWEAKVVSVLIASMPRNPAKGGHYEREVLPLWIRKPKVEV
jgi:hypothetical protein